MLGHANATMTLDTCADLLDEDLDGVADRLDAAIQYAADGESSLADGMCPDLLNTCGAKGV